MRRLFIVVGFLVFTDSQKVCAQAVEGRPASSMYIKQIYLPQNLALVEGGEAESLNIGQWVVTTFPDGSQCTFKVEQVKKEQVVIDLSECQKKEMLKVRQGVELALYQSPLRPLTKEDEIEVVRLEKGHPLQSIYQFVPPTSFGCLGSFRALECRF